MAGKDEEFIGVLYTGLEEMSHPCTIDKLCKAQPGFHNKTEQIKSALQTMCDFDMVIKVNGDEYILKDKYDTLPDPRSVSKCRSLDTDGGSYGEFPAMVPGISKNTSPLSKEPKNPSQVSTEPRNTSSMSREPRNKSPLSREPVTSSNQNTGVMKPGNDIEPLTDCLNGLQITHRNSLGQTAVPQQAMVESSSHSQLSVDSGPAVEYTRQCESIIQVLKSSDRPMLAKDIAQQTNIGQARADVNRMLYFLQTKDVICLTNDKKPFWKFKRDASVVDLEYFGAELASKPDSKRTKNKRNPSSVQPSNDCDCPNAARGCIHYHKHDYYHNVNIQVGSGHQMNTASNQPPALKPPEQDRQ